MPYRRLAAAVLADWHEVQGALATVPYRTREATLLREEAGNLRNEYQRLVDAAVMFDMPVPPAFPPE